MTSCLILLFGCQQNQIESSYSVSDNGIAIINVKVPSSDFPLYHSDVLDTCILVPLKTTDSVLGEITDIQYHNGRYYIIDAKVTNKLFVFSESGEFLFNISNEGQGPGEYQDLRSFVINKSQNTIDIFDDFKRQFLRYTLDGEFIKEIPFELNFTEIQELPDNKYLFYVGKRLNFDISVDKVDTLQYDLFTTDGDYNLTGWQRSFDYSLHNGFKFSLSDHFTQSQGRYFQVPLNDTIFSVSDGGNVSPSAMINYGGYSKPDLIKKDRYEVSDYLRTNPSAVYFTSQYFNLKDWITFDYSFKGKRYYAFVDKNSKEVKTGRPINDYFGFSTYPRLQVKDNLIGTIDPEALLYFLQSYQQNPDFHLEAKIPKSAMTNLESIVNEDAEMLYQYLVIMKPKKSS